MSTKTPMTSDNTAITPESIMQLGLGFWGIEDALKCDCDCSEWMREAGFRETSVEHLAGPDSMVVGIK